MQTSTDLTTQLAHWSQALVGKAQTGLGFANSPYDVERYEELIKLAAEITATINLTAQLDSALAAQLEIFICKTCIALVLLAFPSEPA